MVIYDELENFDTYKDDFKRFQEVKVFKTKYSIKIDYGKKKVFLNKSGNSDEVNILGLINRVKRDAQNYIDKVDFKTTKNNDIFWYLYNDNNGIVRDDLEEFEVAKMDLTSAYWTKGINDGIISKDTVDYFNSLDFPSVKEKKDARLKAFGSLATVKSTEVYNYGKKSKKIIPPIVNHLYRALYMSICNEVAKDMQTVLAYFNGIYYYWDCIFIDPQYILEVEKLFDELGYNCTVEKHKAKIFKSPYISYLCCPNKDGELINYPIK